MGFCHFLLPYDVKGRPERLLVWIPFIFIWLLVVYTINSGLVWPVSPEQLYGRLENLRDYVRNNADVTRLRGGNYF